MTAAPPVSIGLPVFNGARFLRRTLDDLLGQTFGDFELVACDNASTDETPDLLADAAARDPRVRVVRNEANLGALPNTNLAFERSRGDRYVLAAHDDRHAPDFLARLVEALDADPEAVVAYGRSTLIGADGVPFAYVPARRHYVDASGRTYPFDRSLQRRLPDGPVGRYRAVLSSTDVNAPVHGLFRRGALERIGPHEIHGSDRLVASHAALLGTFAFVDRALFGYRIHAASSLHLTREAWFARDSGGVQRPSWRDGARTLRRYLAAVADADLGPVDRLGAVGATLTYAVRPHVLHRLVVPGPDNYWGWSGRPQPSVEKETTEFSQSRSHFEAGWEWLSKGDLEKEGR